jgi:hypothetical protein
MSWDLQQMLSRRSAPKRWLNQEFVIHFAVQRVRMWTLVRSQRIRECGDTIKPSTSLSATIERLQARWHPRAGSTRIAATAVTNP